MTLALTFRLQCNRSLARTVAFTSRFADGGRSEPSPIGVKARLLALVMLGLAGCASIPLPAEVATVTLVPIPSAAVEVHRPKFRMKDGELKLEGYVFRQHNAETTADSHIDLVFLDGVGRTLRVDTTNFSPRSLPRTMRMPQPHAYFLVPVPTVPAGTSAIEVRGHDGRHD